MQNIDYQFFKTTGNFHLIKEKYGFIDSATTNFTE